MATQLMFSMDLNRCINCKTCEMACNEYYGLTDRHRRHVMTYGSKERLTPIHLSISCNHCENPVCISICPENNFQKRWDGIVIHDPRNWFRHSDAPKNLVPQELFHGLTLGGIIQELLIFRSSVSFK
ncbi:hypothetical protein GNT69_16400 [Bacillus sp. B15-48]|nr:hypothetical protein [Bacillus sp. B15-48]